MKKFDLVRSYSAVAALILSLAIGTSQARASEVPTLVELQAAPTMAQSPIIVADIGRVAKAATADRLQLARLVLRFDKLKAELKRIQDRLKNLDPNSAEAKQLLERVTKLQTIVENPKLLAKVEAARIEVATEITQLQDDPNEQDDGEISDTELAQFIEETVAEFSGTE